MRRVLLAPCLLARTVPWCLAAMLSATYACRATPQTIELDPASARIGLTVFAVGLWPVPGRFERFRGELTIDSIPTGDCRVSVEVEVASLRMAGPGRARLALGPSLLDAARYPRLAYAGTCRAGTASGRLTLHGVTLPLSLTARLDGDEVNATGSLRRTDFGVTGLPGLIGRRVDLLLSVTLPPGLAGRLAAELRGQSAGSNARAAPFMQ